VDGLRPGSGERLRRPRRRLLALSLLSGAASRETGSDEVRLGIEWLAFR